MRQYDAVVVGSGPNGLSAAICLARAGLSVVLYEAKDTVGGGLRSEELTLPGFVHDVCSAVHPLAKGSPFFSTLPLQEHGLSWIDSPLVLAHPFTDGSCAVLETSIERTAKRLFKDSAAYERIVGPLAAHWGDLSKDILAPLGMQRHPLLLARFARYALQPATRFMRTYFQTDAMRALFAGLAAHSVLDLDRCITSSFGLVLMLLAHTAAWPIAQGGSKNIAKALASYFTSLGGTIVTDATIESLDELSQHRLVLLDVGPKQFVQMAGRHLSDKSRRRFEAFRYGPGVYKIDWALSDPIPWKARECREAATVHVCGSWQEVVESEKCVWEGRCSSSPFVLVSQPSLFDPTRAPSKRHTAWAYCHVPHGSDADYRDVIEASIERMASGFKECILAAHVRKASEQESYNANLVGGDITGGVQDLYQLFTRPIVQRIPYRTPIKGVYLCSASTPPGGGVHGMCGFWAAHYALKDFGCVCKQSIEHFVRREKSDLASV